MSVPPSSPLMPSLPPEASGCIGTIRPAGTAVLLWAAWKVPLESDRCPGPGALPRTPRTAGLGDTLPCDRVWETASSNEHILFSLLVFDYQGNVGFDISGLTRLDIVVIWERLT